MTRAFAGSAKLFSGARRNETLAGPFARDPRDRPEPVVRLRVAEHEEGEMISEMQIHTIARQMFEKHGLQAIAEAAQKALECEKEGDADEAREWRHIEDAMKMMRGPHQS
jgi:hypothetical protein